MRRFVFIDGGNYWGRILTPARGASHMLSRALKARIGARTLSLKRPDGKDYQGWFGRVPAADWP
jgi:hypothetical protein